MHIRLTMKKKILRGAQKLMSDFKQDAMGDRSKTMVILAAHFNNENSSLLATATGGVEATINLVTNGFAKLFDELLQANGTDNPTYLKEQILTNLEKRLNDVIDTHIVIDQQNKH